MTDKEKTPYHKIMVDAWRIFIKERPDERYSEPWWNDIIADYEKLRTPYKDTLLDGYVCQISQAFLDEYERGQRRGRQKRISETVLSKPQEDYQTELQLSDTVCEVGGFKEIVEPFT